MESSNFRKAIGAFKDHTSRTLAKVATFSNLRVAIVKATDHKVCLAKEHHIREILTLTSYSRCHAASCVSTIAQRLCKTKDWVVAIKALILIQRLMQEGNPLFMQEIFITTYNGTHILDMSDFRDAAWANSWDFSAFVRAYALYLRERLDSWIVECDRTYELFSYTDGEEEEHLSPGTIVIRTTPVWKMQNNQICSRIQYLMKQLDFLLGCQPTGAAKNNRIVALALYPLVKESFQLYYDITEIVFILLDRFEELDVVDSMKVFEILCQVANQYEELESFYYWCNDACIAKTSDYPEINKISQMKLDEMDLFIKQKIEIKQQELIHVPELQLEPKPKPEQEQEQEPEPEQQATPHVISVELVPTTEGYKEEKKDTKTQDIGDLLCFGDDAPTTQENSDQLALALFGYGLVAEASEKTGTQPWEPFNESADWETTLVQTASQLSKHQPSLLEGFDTLLLDSMYQQGATQVAANSGTMTTGSASSIAFGSTGMPTPLALMPPPSANGTSPGEDPFTASLAVPPPSYVQLSDMEKKQRLLVEEQMMWKQHQGQVGMANMYMKQSV
ncbi:putative ANTH domain, ENTH domain, ANTH domain superfamily protein [Helianthus debilis subsp. tardiflorus]